jgi:hypothetical protein
MQATSKRRLLRSVVIVGAALAQVPLALWAVYMLVHMRSIAGRWSFTPVDAHMFFRVVAALVAFWGLWMVARALKRKTVSEAIVPAILVCIVGGVILLETGALWAMQTEVLRDALPELATGTAVILAAVAFGRRWPYAKYAAKAIILVLVGLYAFRNRGLVGAIDPAALSWRILEAWAFKVSELLSLTLPLVLLDLLSDAQQEDSGAEEPTLAERFKAVIGTVSDLPSDTAENHDHHIHGTPKE